MSRLGSSLGAALVWVALVAGCKQSAEADNKAEREANARRVTADSEYDATEPIVDEDFGFRIDPPGPDWKLMQEGDISQLNPDANAGAMSADGTFGFIIVDRLPGASLDEALALLWAEPLPGQVVESEETIEFEGVPARRRAFSAKVSGTSFHYLATVFVRSDHVYQVLSGSTEAGGWAKRQAFHDAISLVEGPVRGRQRQHAPIVDGDGVGWRIREGRYRSALSGVAVELPPGWRYVVGRELKSFNNDAEIIFAHASPEIYVALISEPARDLDVDELVAYNRELFAERVAAPTGDPIERSVAGQRVTFTVHRQDLFEFLHGLYVGSGNISQVLVWYPSSAAEAAGQALDPLLAEISALAPTERETLHEELLDDAPRQRIFATDRAYRAGSFFDYTHGIGWTKPRGFWQLDDFDKALSHSPNTVLFASELELGVYTTIEVIPAANSDATALVAALIEGEEVLEREVVERDGHQLHRVKTIARDGPLVTSYDLAVARHGEKLVALTAWSLAESPATRAAMARAVDGLELAPNLDQSRQEGDTFTDLRFGYSLRLPSKLARPPNVQDNAGARVNAWSAGDQELVTMVMVGTGEEDWAASFFEQMLRDRVSLTQPLGAPTRGEGQLGSFPARRLTWTQGRQNMIVDIVTRDDMVYGVMYVNLPAAQVQAVRHSWSLLE